MTAKRNISVPKETLGRAKGGLHTDRVVMLSEFGELFNDNVSNIIIENVTDTTYDELTTLKANSELVPGVIYKITDRYNYQGYGTGSVPNASLLGDDRGIVYITALTNSTLSKQVVREMACPLTYATGAYSTFTSIGVYNSVKAVSIGNLTIWGAKVFINISGNIGSSIDDVQLNGTDWNELSKDGNTTLYVDKQFFAIYDFANDWFEHQWDGGGNEVGVPIAFKGGNTFNPCDATDWNQTAAQSYNNKAPFGFYNNSVLQLKNNICRGKITGNSGFFHTHNQCHNIINNSVSYLQFNSSYNIQGNLCTFLSYNKNVDGDVTNNTVTSILYNFNYGTIGNNTGTELARNSNGGVIENNVFVNLVNNSNSGHILDNNFTQNIEKNTNKIGNIQNITGQYSMSEDTLHTTSDLLGYEISITGLSAITLTVALAPYISKILLTSANATEVITDIVNFLNNKIVRFSPESALTVTFTHNATKIRGEGALDIVINGTNSDWVEFDKVSNFAALRQYNIGTY